MKLAAAPPAVGRKTRLTRLIALPSLALVGLALSGCSDRREPSSPLGPRALVPSFQAIGNGTWTARAPMPTPRSYLGASAINSILYAVSLEAVQAYDPATDTWATKVPLPTGRSRLGVAAVNGTIYAVGGVDARPDHPIVVFATVEAYDPATNTWTTKASLSAARYGLGVAAINGILYAVSGASPAGTPLTTVEAYDPATNTWTTKRSMPTPRFSLGVAAINGLLYAVGGSNASSGNPLGTVEAYDPATDTWTTKASMPTARWGMGVETLNGMLYTVGGISDANSLTPVATVEAYDPATDTWTQQASMPTARYSLAASANGGILYAVGGANNTGVLATVEAFRPTTPSASAPSPRAWDAAAISNESVYLVGGGLCLAHSSACAAFGQDAIAMTESGRPALSAWALGGSLNHARWGLAATAVNGKIYAIGGTSGSASLPESAVEEYDPLTGAWVTKPMRMKTPRWKSSAATSSGVIFVFGGGTGGNQCIPTGITEAYDPGLDTWASKASMPTARWGSAAVEVGGTLYVLGGSTACPQIIVSPVATLEAYDPSSDSWSRLSPMHVARWDHSAVVANGRIYAIGGYDAQHQTVLNTVEEYNPSTNEWVAKALMPTARTGLVAVATGGLIYAIGGFAGTTVLNVVEVYDPVQDAWLTNGRLAITTQTSGSQLDADGYSVVVDGSPGQPVGVNASVSVAGLGTGTHSVELAGVAPNCAVSGDNPRTVAITAGATSATTFTLTCRATTGSVEVSVATTGVDVDPNGYGVVLDQGNALPVAINGTVTFANVPVGMHSVGLVDVAPNCSILGGGPATIDVTAGNSVHQTFSVTCSPISPVLLVDLESRDFGDVTKFSSSERLFRVTNNGGGTLRGTASTTPPFAIGSGSPFTLGPGAGTWVSVTFTPTTKGLFLQSLTFSSNGGSPSIRISGESSGRCQSFTDFLLAGDKCALLTQLREPEYFGIPHELARTEALWNFIGLGSNMKELQARVATVDYGRDLQAFVTYKKNFLATEQAYLDKVNTARSVLVNGLRATALTLGAAESPAAEVLNGAIGPVDKLLLGYQVYRLFVGAYEAYNTRPLLSFYFADRRNMDQTTAWSLDLARDSDFGPLVRGIAVARGVPDACVDDWFENAFQAYRLVGYDDSDQIRADEGRAIAKLASTGNDVFPVTKTKPGSACT